MTWRRRMCREDGSCGRTVVVHVEIAEQSVKAYSQTMLNNYLRGIVLSWFSLAVVNASKVVEGLRLRD